MKSKAPQILAILLLMLLNPNMGMAQYSTDSSCESDSSLTHLLEKDAKRLAIRQLYETKNADTCLIDVPEVYTKQALSALAAVYNAMPLEARKEVIELYDIHALGNPSLNTVLLYLDANFDWAQFLNSQTSSGYDQVDNLINKYALTLDASKLMENGEVLVRLRTVHNLNMAALGESFAKLEGVKRWQADEIVGEAAKDITMQMSGNDIELIYRYSWKDCSKKCVNNHFWRFKINADCNVTFMGNLGDPLAIDLIEQLIEIRLFPNPSADEVYVNLVGPPQKGMEMQLFNSSGKLLQTKKVASSNGVVETQLSLASYPIGIYFIAFKNGKRILTEIILKR